MARNLLKDEKSRKRFPKKLGKEVVRIVDAAKTKRGLKMRETLGVSSEL